MRLYIRILLIMFFRCCIYFVFIYLCGRFFSFVHISELGVSLCAFSIRFAGVSSRNSYYSLLPDCYMGLHFTLSRSATHSHKETHLRSLHSVVYVRPQNECFKIMHSPLLMRRLSTVTTEQCLSLGCTRRSSADIFFFFAEGPINLKRKLCGAFHLISKRNAFWNLSRIYISGIRLAFEPNI